MYNNYTATCLYDMSCAVFVYDVYYVHEFCITSCANTCVPCNIKCTALVPVGKANWYHQRSMYNYMYMCWYVLYSVLYVFVPSSTMFLYVCVCFCIVNMFVLCNACVCTIHFQVRWCQQPRHTCCYQEEISPTFQTKRSDDAYLCMLDPDVLYLDL